MLLPRRGFRTRPVRIGFTIFELLIVIAVIGILIALLLPALSTTRESARRSMCSANQKQLALAVLMYQETRATYPTSAFFGKLDPLQGKLSVVVPGSNKDDKTKAPYSFLVRLLPYIEQGFLYDEIDFKKNAFAEANLDIASSVLPLFMCPSHDGPVQSNAVEYKWDEKPALTQYKAIGTTTFAVLDDPEAVKDAKGDGGVLQPYVAVRAVANFSQTIMLGETKEPVLLGLVRRDHGVNSRIPSGNRQDQEGDNRGDQLPNPGASGFPYEEAVRRGRRHAVGREQ